MPVHHSSARAVAPAPPRPAGPRALRQLDPPRLHAAGLGSIDLAETGETAPRAPREARALSLVAFAVAATALLMPFTALVCLALATVAHAKGDERLGRAAFLTSLAAMATGFALNLTVIDVML